LSGIGTNAVILIFTLIFIDIIIENKNDKRRKAFQEIALGKFKNAIVGNLNHLLTITFKFETDTNLEINKAFNKDFYDKIKQIDVTEICTLCYPQMAYSTYVSQHFLILKKDIYEIQDKYLTMILLMNCITLNHIWKSQYLQHLTELSLLQKCLNQNYLRIYLLTWKMN
jgi:hypothetical protein